MSPLTLIDVLDISADEAYSLTVIPNCEWTVNGRDLVGEIDAVLVDENYQVKHIIEVKRNCFDIYSGSKRPTTDSVMRANACSAESPSRIADVIDARIF